MADEPITQPVATPESTPAVVPPAVNPAQERITDLSSKVKTTSEERDAANARADAAEKKAAFAEAFVEIIAANPAAKDHKADIEAKVLSGYTPQDASFAVLGAKGLLGAPKVDRAPIGGGSASTPITNQPNKELTNMTKAELRAALVEEEKKGNISYN